MATEPPHEELMNRPLVGREVSLISKTMWRNIIGQSIFQLAILLVSNFTGKKILRLEGSDATIVLNTFIFNNFVFCQVLAVNFGALYGWKINEHFPCYGFTCVILSLRYFPWFDTGS